MLKRKGHRIRRDITIRSQEEKEKKPVLVDSCFYAEAMRSHPIRTKIIGGNI